MSLLTKRAEARVTAEHTQDDVGSKFREQDATAAAPTLGSTPLAADDVSNLTAAQFAACPHMYQVANSQAAAIHGIFLNTLSMSSRTYAAIKAADTAADS